MAGRRRYDSLGGDEGSFLISQRFTARELHQQIGSSTSSADVNRSYGSFTRQNTCKAFKIERGMSNLLSTTYESLDYDTCENTLVLDEERQSNYNTYWRRNVTRWFVMALIGIFTGCTACFVDVAIQFLSNLKYSQLKKYVDKCVQQDCLIQPYLLWLAFNVSSVLIASILVAYVEPVALGSGISQVKCYLNGVKVPRIVRVRTMFVKVIGVIMSVVGGLAVGKEGPMIHSGAVIAAGISQGKSTTFGKDFNIFKYFRNDKEKRDFVCGGAAAGVSAAFGAPVGGVLFSLEEGASFWNQPLTWRIFFCSMVSTFTLNVILSSYNGHPGQLDYAGLLNFGKFEKIAYNFWEIPLFLAMGAIGGLLGAIFNQINFKLAVFRLRYIYLKWAKVLEAVIVALTTATVGFSMIYFLNDCKTLGKDPTEHPIQFYCGDGEYNALGAIWFQTPESSVKSLFHDPPGSHQPLSIGLFFILYFFLSCWTYGLSVPSGLFIPSLLTGAAWGRMVGMIMELVFPNKDWVDPGKYALVGAAAQLGGVVRMTLSLTVILIEATGNINFGLPLMIVLIVSKWVADYFNEGIYDCYIQLAQVPLLAWEPPPYSNNIYASEVMSHPVTTFRFVEKVGNLVDTLRSETHNGFPVVDVDYYNADENRTFGRFRGVILRTQLIFLLQNKVYNEIKDDTIEWRKPKTEDFWDCYPRYPAIEDVSVPDSERDCTIDLKPYLNPAPYTILYNASLPRIFRLFRALGLRHLVVVDESNEVLGMVTRKDLARYRFTHHRGNYGLEELHIAKE